MACKASTSLFQEQINIIWQCNFRKKGLRRGNHSSLISCDYNHLHLLLDFMPYQQDHNDAPGL